MYIGGGADPSIVSVKWGSGGRSPPETMGILAIKS